MSPSLQLVKPVQISYLFEKGLCLKKSEEMWNNKLGEETLKPLPNRMNLEKTTIDGSTYRLFVNAKDGSAFAESTEFFFFKVIFETVLCIFQERDMEENLYYAGARRMHLKMEHAFEVECLPDEARTKMPHCLHSFEARRKQQQQQPFYFFLFFLFRFSFPHPLPSSLL